MEESWNALGWPDQNWINPMDTFSNSWGTSDNTFIDSSWGVLLSPATSDDNLEVNVDHGNFLGGWISDQVTWGMFIILVSSFILY
jgi:hypothetical protein